MNQKIVNIIVIILVIFLAIINPLVMGLAAIGVWIYLIIKIQKKKTENFSDQINSKLAQIYLKRIKTFLLIALIIFIISAAGIILHNIQFGLSEMEKDISFYIGVGGLWVFIILTGIGLIFFLKGRQKTE